MSLHPRYRSLPLGNSVLGENTSLVKTLSSQERKLALKHFNSLTGRLMRANVYFVNGEPFRFQPTVFERGLKNFLKTHRFLLVQRSRYYDRIDYAYYAEDPPERLRVFEPAYLGVLTIDGKTAEIQEIYRSSTPKLPPIIICQELTDKWVWITSRVPMHQCPNCGRFWLKDHACNEIRSAFYFHAVDKGGRKLWQHVPFRCPAQPPFMRQLYITYDIETYTIFERRGKRMHPFMLCFTLSGDRVLHAKAEAIALKDPHIKRLRGGYYWIDYRPGAVARKFRNFRTQLQEHFSRDLVRRFYKHNKDYFKTLLEDGRYPSIFDIPNEMVEQPSVPLTLPDDFYVTNIVIIGHNASKFDEILLATEFVERRDLFPQIVRCTRTFMPRVGRLLFNDIHFTLPNPNYLKNDPSRTERWCRGELQMRDLRRIGVRFLVRDTLQLTSGAKLSKAAAAYALELTKGECPYEAINDYVSTGQYESDDDGFPVTRYWESEQVKEEQKSLWARERPGEPYNIIEACLEYCMQDVKVTEALAHTLYVNYSKYFKEELGMVGEYNIFERPTIPSNTHAFWKQIAFSSYVRKMAANPPCRKGRRKVIPHDYVALLYAPYRPMFKYIRQALRGGRCYPTILGPYREPVYVFDICGMYASALTHPMPHGMPLDPRFTAKHVDELNVILSNERHISYFDTRIKPSILKIDAYPPPVNMLDSLPPICSRRGGRLVWSNEALHDEVITVIDIITLHNRGWKVTVLHDEMNIVFPEWATICADYVSKNIAAKEKADKEKNEVMRSISKMLSNALYGAFATNMDTSRVVFEQDLSEKDKDAIYQGTQVVKHVTLLNDDSLSGHQVCLGSGGTPNSPWSERGYGNSTLYDEGTSKPEDTLTEEPSLTDVDRDLQGALENPSLIYQKEYRDGSAYVASANDTQFKPMTLLEATPDALTVLHLENLDQMVENKRYPTQLACFVLGWSRAFYSEWCEILHDPDRGTHQHDRQPQSLYGDTDSIFVTESGYKRMKERGAHRIKSKDTRLTFDPANPALYWACDCDIKCKKCQSDTYASESIYLAPKLYGLKDAVCTNPDCGYVGPGKIRSKGHKQSELVYETLLKCWERYEDETYGGTTDIPELNTSRTIFKATLLNKVSRYEPFTIHTEPLVRVLRPWKDLTLYSHGNYLYPYDTAHPNPRTCQNTRQVPDVGHEDPLAPLDLDPHTFLTTEECDELLETLHEWDDGIPETENMEL